MTIGEKIKFLRTNNNMTQGELANKLNLTTPSAVSKYESNMVPVPQDTIVRLATIFDVTTDYILKGDIFDEPMAVAAKTKVGIDISDLPKSDIDLIKSIIENFRNRK